MIRFAVLFLLTLLAAGRAVRADSADSGPPEYSFITAGDMRHFVDGAPPGKRYFDGVCETIRRIGPGDFMLSPGDCDPPAPVRAMLDWYLGTNYVWYPVIGNHDADSKDDMQWMRHWSEAGIPGLVRRGPAGAEDTIYSFDHANSHFIVMNDYYDGKTDAIGSGQVPDATLTWMRADLAATRQPLIWVTGHKPIQSVPDMDTGRIRHGNDPITSNAAHMDEFVNLLKEYHTRAYLCGHTHDASIAKVKGLWQADSGHARGAGDTGAPSTFLKFRIFGARAWVDVYRSDPTGVNYKLRQTVELK
jgi:Calcineurin-like phosphoesterase